jgi:uncharacterized membrane protein
MVVFHFLYDVFLVYGKNPSWYYTPSIHVWQQMICWTFIFVSGFVWSWGMKGNLWRGIRLNIYGLIISVVTLIVIPTETIWFGILNFMGCAVLLMFLFQKVAKKICPALGLAVCLLLFLLCKHIQYGYIGIGNRIWLEIPKIVYSVKILTPLGFPFSGFKSSDYFPIFPWMFLYLCGYFCNELVMKNSIVQRILCYKIPILSYVGSKTIWIYLFHQPISMLICMIIFR